MPELASYLDSVNDSLKGCEPDIQRAIDVIREVRERGRRLWVLGNGGSLAIAQHFAQDLVKMRYIRAQAFTCPSMLTAYTNDQSFEECMSSPLSVLMDEDDAILIFSCSGRSRNYMELLKPKNIRGPIISVVGCDGGFLKQHSKVAVHVKNENYQVCETAFCVVADLINLALEE